MELEFMTNLAGDKDFKYVAKADQLTLTDQPEVQVDEDDNVEPIKTKSYVQRKETGERPERQITTPTMSTEDKPLVIFVDGSDMNKQSANNVIGYGAWFNYNGKDYGLSGTKTNVDRILSQFKDLKMSNPTMEMLGLLEVLNRFKTTKEHILIRQDYSGAVNYGTLWDHSTGSEQRAAKPWVAKEPYIKYIVNEIEKAIKELEDNGGSIRIQWVPGHIDSSKISKYPSVFQGSDGMVSQAIVDRLTKGNDSADVYAKWDLSADFFSDIINEFYSRGTEQLDLFSNAQDVTDEQADERKKECE